MQAIGFLLYWKTKINIIIINTDLFVLLEYRFCHKDGGGNLKLSETGYSIYHFENIENQLNIQIF